MPFLHSFRKRFPILLKLAGMLLAGYLVWRTLCLSDISFRQSLRSARISLLLLAFMLYGLVQLAGAWRWKILMDIQGIPLPFRKIFCYTMYTEAVNCLLPGAVTGDVVRLAGILPSLSAEKRIAATCSVLADRFAGIIGLLIAASLSVLFLLFSSQCPLDTPELRIIRNTLIVLILLGIILGKWFTSFLAFLKRIPLLRRFFHHLPSSLQQNIRQFLLAIRQFYAAPLAGLKAVLLSLGIHCTLGTTLFLLGKAFHETSMTFFQYQMTTQIGNVASAVPVTPGGIGLRDAISAFFLQTFQASPPEVLGFIPVAYTLILLLWAFIGLAFKAK